MDGALKYVCMNGCKSHALWRMGIRRVYDVMGSRRVYDVMYVCVGTHTSLENYRYVCLRVCDAWVLDVCMTSCMYVWGNIHR